MPSPTRLHIVECGISVWSLWWAVDGRGLLVSTGSQNRTHTHSRHPRVHAAGPGSRASRVFSFPIVAQMHGTMFQPTSHTGLQMTDGVQIALRQRANIMLKLCELAESH